MKFVVSTLGDSRMVKIKKKLIRPVGESIISFTGNDLRLEFVPRLTQRGSSSLIYNYVKMMFLYTVLMKCDV